MLADGRLGYFEPFSGPGEVPGFGRGDERLEVPQFHAVIIAGRKGNSPTFASVPTGGVPWHGSTPPAGISS